MLALSTDDLEARIVAFLEAHPQAVAVCRTQESPSFSRGLQKAVELGQELAEDEIRRRSDGSLGHADFFALNS